MEELIKIKETDGVKTVSARELYEKLGIEHRFNNWFKSMLKYGFVENKDYTSVLVCTEVQNNGGIQKRELSEYYLSLDMAKEICMIQRTEIGRTFRQYFIDCEEKVKTIETKTVVIPQKTEREMNIEEAHILENLIPICPVETSKQILASYISKKITGEFLLPLPKANKETYTATQIANELKVSRKIIGKIANTHNLKQEEYGEWIWDRAVNGKQVKNFIYNSKGFERIKELVNM